MAENPEYWMAIYREGGMVLWYCGGKVDFKAKIENHRVPCIRKGGRENELIAVILDRTIWPFDV